MKATVVQIESGDRYTDKLRRVTLRFEGARVGMDAITVPVTSLPEGVGLDDVLEVRISLHHRERLETIPPARMVAEGKW